MRPTDAQRGIAVDRELMRSRRQELRLDQGTLGERVGVTARWISMIETGQRRPSLPLAGRLEEVLGVTLGYDPEAGDEPDGLAALRAVEDQLTATIGELWSQRERVRGQVAALRQQVAA